LARVSMMGKTTTKTTAKKAGCAPDEVRRQVT
jgi:hypothetical protein